MCARRVVAGDGTTHPVRPDPALPARLLDHVEGARRVEADPLGERQHLGGAGQVDGGQQVVDELGPRPVPGSDADAKDLCRERADERFVRSEGRVGTRHHQAHAAVAGARRAAGHRRGDASDAALAEAQGDRFGALRADRRAEQDAGAATGAMHEAIAAEQNALALRRIDDSDDDDVMRCGQRRGRRKGTRTMTFKLGLARRVDITNADLVAMLEQA